MIMEEGTPPYLGIQLREGSCHKIPISDEDGILFP